jgi:hypothetical protein
MRWLLFLSRLAFICGLFLLVSISLQLYNWVHEEVIISTIFIIAYFIGIVVIPAVNMCYLAVLIARKNLSMVPLWLSLSNLLFLFIQLFFVFYLNFQLSK